MTEPVLVGESELADRFADRETSSRTHGLMMSHFLTDRGVKAALRGNVCRG